MENFRQGRNTNERPVESEQKKNPKIGNLIRALGFMALGATAIEGGHQVNRALSPEQTAMSQTESLDLLGVSVPEAGAFTEFWEENKENVTSMILSEDSTDSNLGKEFVETMTQAINKVEEIAQMESDLKMAHEELSGIYAKIQLQQQQLEAQGVSFEVEQDSNELVEGNFTNWDSWTNVAVETPGSLIKEQVDLALEQEPAAIDLSQEKKAIEMEPTERKGIVLD
jgi:hypothetical protein